MADINANVASEGLRVRDFVLGAARFVASQNTRTAGLMENPLHLADGPPTASLSPLIPAVNPSESLKIAASGQIDLYGTGVQVRMADWSAGSGAFIGMEALGGPESVRMTDTLGAGIDLFPPALSEAFVCKDDHWENAAEQSSVEGLKVVDGPPLAVLTPISAQVVPDEALKLAEALSAAIDPELGAPGQEALHVQDQVLPALQLAQSVAQEALKISDLALPAMDLIASPSEAVRPSDAANGILDLIPPVLTESGRLADTLSALENPLQGNPTAEAVHVQDAAFTGNDLSTIVQPTEACRMADTALAEVTPLVRQVPDESGKLSDAPQAQETPLLQAQASLDSLKVSDSASGQLDTLLGTASESLKVQDAASGSTDALVALVVPEGLKAQDWASQSAAGLSNSDISAPTLLEGLKVQDSAATSLALSAGPSEGASIQDDALGQLDPLLAQAPSEGVSPDDLDPESLGDYIFATASEALHLREQAYTVPVEPDEDWACEVPADPWTCTVEAED